MAYMVTVWDAFIRGVFSAGEDGEGMQRLRQGMLGQALYLYAMQNGPMPALQGRG